MSPELAEALARLTSALDALDSVVGRHLDVDGRRSDLETELQVMQDDRARLATDLKGATHRLGQVEAVHEHVGARVDSAIAAIRDVLGDPAPGRSA